MAAPTDAREHLRADCARCSGLCCVAPAFAASADFAVDKPAGSPCTHLREDSRCGIHSTLRDRGFPGCTVFDCFGAGQQLTRRTFGGRTWRDSPQLAGEVFAIFPIVHQLHELRWYLAEARSRPETAPLHPTLDAAAERAARLAGGTPAELLRLDAVGERRAAGSLLQQASELVRARIPHRGRDRRNADLMGADLRRALVRGASLRGALLVGADLRGVDLTGTDLLGADLRAADARGADLTDALYLTQPQADAARGDAATRLPTALRRPGWWPV